MFLPLLRISLCLLMCLVCGAPYICAQNIKAGIEGRVVDAQSAAIAGAQVVITDTQRGINRRVTTDAQGAFSQTGLEPGTYTIEVTQTGFAPYRREAVALQVGEVARLDVVLQVAGVASEVTVASEDVKLLQLSDAKQARSFSSTEMNDLPVQANGQGRNFYVQARTAPGVAATTAAHQPFSVSGNRPRSNNYLVDSVDTTDANTGLIAGRGVTEQIISQEAIASFEILTHNFKAEYGRNSGGIVSLVTKSGTNEFHGSGYWYHNNSALSARNFFDATKPSNRSNLAGFTVGGPVIKNRAYFFGQYEVFRIRGEQPTLFQGLTDAERAAAVPAVRALVALYPRIPASGSRIFSVGTPVFTNQYTYLVRGDVALTPAQILMMRVSNTHSFRESISVGNIIGSRAPGVRQTFGATVQHNWTINPTLLNEARLGYNRQVENDSETPSPLFLGDPALNGQVGALRVTGLSSLGIPNYLNQHLFQNNYQFIDDLTWTKGRHTFKFGTSVRRIQVNGGNIDSSFRGVLTFNSISSFLAGMPASYTINIGNPRIGLRRTEWHSYAQDDWKVTPRLTLNLGLRYELNTAPREVCDRIPHEYLLVTDKNNFAPRFGFAWQAFNKTVVRGGYGIFYNVVETTFLGLTRFNPPLIRTFSVVNPTFPNLSAQARAGLPSGLVVPNPNTRTPYAQHLNFTIERELFNPQSTLSVAYVGTLGRKLSRTRRPNGGEQLPQGLRPDPTVGVVNVLETSANSSYHSLQIDYTQRFNSDLQVRAAYTYSKFIDDISDIASSNTNLDRGVIPFDENRLYLDRAISTWDIPHILTFTYIYRLPLFRANRFLGGWTISGVNTIQSGRPYTIYTGTNTPLGNNNNRPLDVAGSLIRHPSSATPITYSPGFNALALRPANGTFGTLGRNTERGDAYFDSSVSLSKDFVMNEHIRLQLRGELFNVFNVTNFRDVDNVMTSPTFGRYTSAFDPRRAQLAVRIVF